MSEWLDEADKAIQAKEEEDEKTSNAEIWKPEEGDVIKGTLISGVLIEGRYGPEYILAIEDTDNKMWKVFASNKVIFDAVAAQMPAPGKGLAIKFGGMKQPSKPGGNEYKSFTLQCEGTDPEYWVGAAKVYRAKQLEAQESYRGSSADDMEAPY